MGSTELVFVNAYYSLPHAAEDGEWMAYYAPLDFDRLGKDLKCYVGNQLERFSEMSNYTDWFNIIDYGPRLSDLIPADEEAIFCSALSPRDKSVEFDELDPMEKLQGFRAVIASRLTSGELAEIRSGVEFFNWIMEGALNGIDFEKPCSSISVEGAAEFGPRFVERLRASVEGLEGPQRYAPYSRFIGKEFAPLKPLLEIVHGLVHSAEWPQSDFALGKLLLMVDYFKYVVEERWQS